MTYIVETAMLDTWENCWTCEDQPQTYETLDEATAAIEEHINDCRQAVMLGYMDDAPDYAEFRIVGNGKVYEYVPTANYEEVKECAS